MGIKLGLERIGIVDFMGIASSWYYTALSPTALISAPIHHLVSQQALGRNCLIRHDYGPCGELRLRHIKLRKSVPFTMQG